VITSQRDATIIYTHITRSQIQATQDRQVLNLLL